MTRIDPTQTEVSYAMHQIRRMTRWVLNCRTRFGRFLSGRSVRRLTGAAALAALLAATGAVSGCTTNPATGEEMFSLMSLQEEKQIGAEQHPKLIDTFGGPISDPEITRYVQSVGQLLARTSEMPELDFTFTVLDTDTVNAFALPGGYVYITRGLMTLANSEAEMAGVLAHEIGHVTARHSAQRYSRSVVAEVGTQILGILTGSRELTQLAGTGAGLYLRSYSREHEFQADKLGVRYLKRAGFRADAMASFLASLRDHSQLQARLAGMPESAVDEFNIMATHPRTIERVEQAMELAGNGEPADPIVGRQTYLKKIDGMIFGSSPEEGFIRGREFLHPEMRIRFRVPEGFALRNEPTQVTARHEDGSIIIFGHAAQAGNRTPVDYLANVWARGRSLRQLESFTVNGLSAATGGLRLNTDQGLRDLRLVAIRVDADIMLRFLFVTPPNETERLADAFRDTIQSFAKVGAAEASGWAPQRIRIVTVRSGDTVAGLAARMVVDEAPEDHFRVLNGIGPGETVVAGEQVKIVIVE